MIIHQKKEYMKNSSKQFIKKESKNKIKHDSITLEIFDGNRQIRTLKFKTPKESGVHKTNWYLREKGVARASRKIKISKIEPGGVSVKPGIYQLKMTFGETISTQTITVEYDPRLELSKKAINQKYNASKTLENYQEKITNIVKQLVESKNTATNFSKTLKKEDKKLHKDAIDLSTEISETIENLISLYIGKEDKRQGITRNPEVTVLNRIRTASWYGGSRPDGITQTEITLLKHAQDQLNDALDKTNAFFEKDWLAYKDAMTDVKTKHFKDTKIFSKN